MRKVTDNLAFVFVITLVLSLVLFSSALYSQRLLPSGDRFDDSRTIIACHIAFLGLASLGLSLVVGLIITARRYRQRCRVPSVEPMNWFEALINNGCAIGITLSLSSFCISLFLTLVASKRPESMAELSINHIPVLRYLMATSFRNSAIAAAVLSVVFVLLAGITTMMVFLRDVASMSEQRDD